MRIAGSEEFTFRIDCIVKSNFLQSSNSSSLFKSNSEMELSILYNPYITNISWNLTFQFLST